MEQEIKKVRKVLLVYKKSAYQSYFRSYQSPSFKRIAASGDRGLKHFKRTHDVHYESLRQVKAVLNDKNISFDVLGRGERYSGAYDLVVSVGGDGTFLDAVRFATKQPILAVNSDISHSVGQFCSAHKDNFSRVLNAYLSGRRKPKKLHRLSLKLNKRTLPVFAANDVLVCHASPAAMSHYILEVGHPVEQQRSSGVWIATAAGSTGAIRSAGGRPLLLESDKIQYLPRELFEGHGVRYKLRGGVVAPNTSLSIVSQMPKGMIYVDGAHWKTPFKYGDRLQIVSAHSPVRLI